MLCALLTWLFMKSSGREENFRKLAAKVASFSVEI